MSRVDESMGIGGPGFDQRHMTDIEDDSSELEQIAKIDDWCMDNSNKSNARKWHLQAENILDRYNVEDWSALEREDDSAIDELIDYAYDLGIIK